MDVLTADSKLGSGGTLELNTIRQKHLENAEEYQEVGLPAASVEARFGSATREAVALVQTRNFTASIVVVNEGYEIRSTKQSLKAITARISRVLSQQYELAKQLDDLPSEIDGSTGSVEIDITNVIMDSTEIENTNTFRGVAELIADIRVLVTEPTDTATVASPTTSYANDDLYNIGAEFVIKALQEDTALGSGGAYEVNLWEQEHREDFGTYMDYQLPAISTEVSFSSQSVEQISGVTQVGLLGSVVVVREAYDLPTLKSDLLEHTARVERCLTQQYLPTRQMARMPEVIGGAEKGTLTCNVADLDLTVGELAHRFRGFAEISFSIGFGLTY
ncbi:hypothetical protein CMI37_18285 [Candidatus Pacearchaeota archaeon]|nr:hypothetical protein [Candidatus Pacearchaeota archaeon]